MSIDRVREYMKQFGMQDRILEFEVSSATVELAAVAVGCEPARIAKTLSFMVDGVATLVVAAGDLNGTVRSSKQAVLVSGTVIEFIK